MFEVTFLGTAASTPSAERGLPAVLVQAAGERFLIDCGEGTQRQMLRAGSGGPPGPLRAELAAGRSVMLPDGRRIGPDSVRGPPAAGASLAVVGDTEEADTLIGPVGGADALVIEATFLERDAALAGERGHLTAAAAGRLAAAGKSARFT